MLKGKKIVLGITGSIADYKACLIIRGLIKRGVEVQVVSYTHLRAHETGRNPVCRLLLEKKKKKKKNKKKKTRI